MKPWEETWVPSLWRHDGQQRPMWAVEPDTKDPLDGEPIFEFNDPDQEARAKLAAAAPEMARELLAREWNHSYEESVCPSCDASQPYPEPKRPGVGHKPDCDWVVALRKAGVIPPACDHATSLVFNAYGMRVCSECAEHVPPSPT